jgi:hypothetical protein
LIEIAEAGAFIQFAAGSISASNVSTKKQVVIPDGIGKSSEDSFFALLDEAIAVGESET